MAARTSCARIARTALTRPAYRPCTPRVWSSAPTQPAQSGLRAFTLSTPARAKRYTQDHEWIEMDADNTTGTIGISTYAAAALGDVVFVELPTPDTPVSAGDTIGAVESVKSASDILTPVSGTIVEANGALEAAPGTINKGPEAEGWIARVRVKDVAELEDLMDAEAYAKFTEE